MTGAGAGNEEPMDDWTKGYIADVDYSQGYYRELTPSFLSFALLSQGIRPPNLTGKLRYCELGAGHGFTCNVVAATHPEGEVWATDFNPAFAATARRIADAAGISNIKVFDSSFEEFAAFDLPPFDMIVLHGIYSWVMAEHRKSIVDFIRDRLAFGGVVYLSYNCLPGWAPILPLRRLLSEMAQRATGSTEERIEKALDEAEELAALGAGYLQANESARTQLGKIRGMSRQYIAHEYFNRIWTPLYHLDVARQMHQAKLTFAASAELQHHVERLCLTPEQRTKIASIDDPPFRETVRDLMLNQQFRKDIFVRGPERLLASERRELLLKTRFALVWPRNQVELGASYTQGIYPLDGGPAAELLDALVSGPKTMAEMVSSADPAEFERKVEAMVVLVGTGRVEPGLPAAGDAERAERTRRFNDVILDRARHGDQLQSMVSPVLGGAIKVERLHRLFLLGEAQGQKDAASFAYAIMREEMEAEKRQGKQVRPPSPLGVMMLAQRFDSETRPILAQHGIV
jgi:phospholipid N-methyltransferase